jgi:hypothetical protein
VKPDPLDNPTRNAATLNNLVSNMRAIHIMPLLEELTFDRVTELWWQAQARRAEREERITQGHMPASVPNG